MVHVVRLADRQRNDRQGRIASPGARELTAIADEQILDIVGLTPAVANPVGGLSAYPQRAHVVAVGKWAAAAAMHDPSGRARCSQGCQLMEELSEKCH